MGWSLLRAVGRCRKGATALEFALVAPVFLAMVFGIFEVGRAMWIKSVLQYALEETTRYAIVNTSASMATLQTYAKSKMAESFVDSGAVTVPLPATSIVAGVTYVSITASYSFNSVIPIAGIPTINLQAKSMVPLS
ncbi:MAG: pilus assembly protein [Magnetospirillum sp. WYHS-4]